MLNKFRKLKGYLVSNTTPIPKEETKKEAVNQEYSISEYPKPQTTSQKTRNTTKKKSRKTSQETGKGAYLKRKQKIKIKEDAK